MAAQMIYPTAPPGARAEGVEHVESSGNPEGMLSKVKRRARNLRDKIKKATGTDSTDHDHGDINRRDQDELRQHAPGPEDEEVDEGAESREDDEEEHDHISSADNQFKHQQLHSTGALDNQEGGPDGVKNLSLEHSTHGEAAEPDKNLSWSKWSADKHDKVKDEGSSLTSPPTTLDGVTYEPNDVAQSYGTGESLDNRTSASDYPNTSVEEKPISDTADGHNAVDGAVAVSGDRAPNLQDNEYVDALSKPPVSEDVRKDVGEEDFYDPNDVSDNQVREGLALGSGDADEDALNSPLPGSGIGKVQELKDTVAPTLSYDNTSSPHTDGGGDGEEHPYFAREDVNFSPTQQQTGFVEGPKDTEVSTFGNGKEQVSHRDEGEQSRVAETEQKPGIALGSGDADEDALNSTLPGSDIGKLQGLKDTVAPTLSYGNTFSPHTDGGGDGKDQPYFAREDVDEVSHRDEGDRSRVAEREDIPGIALGSGDTDEDALNSTDGGGDGEDQPYFAREDANFPPTQQQKGFVQGPEDTVVSTFGYGKEPADEVLHGDEGEKSCVAEREHKPEVDIDGSQPQTGASQGFGNGVASKLGCGTAGELPSPPENLHTHNTPIVTETDEQPRYEDGGENAGVGNTGYVSSVAGDDADREGESHSPQQTGVFQGMENMVSSTHGYNGSEGAHTAETEHMTHDEVPAVSSTEGKSDSQQQPSTADMGHMTHDEVPAVSPTEGKPYSPGVFQGMKHMIASTFGYGSEGAHTADTARTADTAHVTHD